MVQFIEFQNNLAADNENSFFSQARYTYINQVKKEWYRKMAIVRNSELSICQHLHYR